jgi:uncharacterized protein involved in exopolysaccharide biosynthesis
MRYNIHILYRMVDSFIRHRWLFLIAFLTTTGSAVTGLTLRSTTYQESARTRILPNDTAVVLGSSFDSKTLMSVSAAHQSVERFNSLIQDDRPGGFLDNSLRKAKLQRPINIDPRAKDPRYALLRKRLSVNPDSDSLFSISLTWDDPRECERILGALQDQYIQEVGRSQQAQAVATATFLDNQIVSYEQRMRAAEQALIDYKQRNSGQSPEAQTADFAQLASLQIKLDDLRITSKDNELKRQALEKRIAQVTPMNIKEQTFGDSPTTQQIRELQARRNLLLADGWLPTSIRVQALDGQIANLRKQLETETPANSSRPGSVFETKLQNNPEYETLTQQLTQVNISQTTQKVQMQQLQQRIEQYESRIERIPPAERELADKMRNYSVLKGQYENLLQRREDARMKANLDEVSARSTLSPIGVIHAERTLGKVKMLMMLVASLFAGLLVGVTMVFLSEWTDRSLRYEVDAERMLELPVLVSIANTSDLPSQAGRSRRNGKPASAASRNGSGGFPRENGMRVDR